MIEPDCKSERSWKIEINQNSGANGRVILASYHILAPVICGFKREIQSIDRITSSHYALLFGDIHVLQRELYSYL
jgi:hypothetical protein